MSQKIIDALKKLDPANEEHWTTEGLPRLDVLKDLIGESVSRVDVTNAARGFSRATTSVLEQAAPAAPAAPQENVVTGGVASLTTTVETLAPTVQSNLDEDDADYIEHLRDKKASLEAAVNEAGEKATAARAEFQALQKQLNQVDAELANVTKVNESTIFSDTIRAYQESQKQQRTATAEKAIALNKALELVAQGKVV